MRQNPIQALNDEITHQGYHMLLCVSGYAAESEAEIVATLLTRRPDGIVLTGIHHTRALKKMILQAAIPVVEIWDMTPTPIDMLVGFSHEKTGYQLGLFLVKKGYQRPALIWTEDQRARQRRRGLEDALQQLKISVQSVVPVSLPASMQGGREAFAVLEDLPNIDIVICSSDTVAQGVMVEAETQQLRVPEDIAVAGFGDLPFAAFHRPSITTIRIDRQTIGQQAVRALLARLAGRNDYPQVIDVGFEIIQRESA